MCRSSQNVIVQIKERYGSKLFLDLIENNILPNLNRGCEDKKFVVDQFPVLVCSTVRDWFTKQNKLSLLILPPNSSDLNPVSKLCDYIVKTLNSKRVDVKNVTELWKNISETFHAVTTTTFVGDCITQIPVLIETIAVNEGNS